MEEQTLNVGGHDTRVTTLEDGTKLFRSNAADIETIEICLIDNVGRQVVILGNRTTILVMTPIGHLGAVAFDPLMKPLEGVGMAHAIVDDEGRPCFAQRPAMSRAEVFSIVEDVVAKNRGRLDVPNDQLRRALRFT